MSATQAGPSGDPRIGWSTAEQPHAPALLHRRDGILPTVAAALSVRGETLTGTAARGDQAPPLHPLVQEFLDSLATDRRDRFTGRCAEATLISRHITGADAARSRRAARRPMSNGEARKDEDAATQLAHDARSGSSHGHRSTRGTARQGAAHRS